MNLPHRRQSDRTDHRLNVLLAAFAVATWTMVAFVSYEVFEARVATAQVK